MSDMLKIIYSDSTANCNFELLTMLSLLYDEIVFFSSNNLDEIVEDLNKKKNKREIDNIKGENKLKFYESIKILVPEKVVSLIYPENSKNIFPLADEVEIDIGIPEVLEKENKKQLLLKPSKEKVNYFTELLFQFLKYQKGVKVSTLIRDLNLLSVAYTYNIPIITDKSFYNANSSSNNVSLISEILMHQTLNKLALPRFNAYSADDILLARIKLKDELQNFKAAILDLVWILHQKVDISSDINLVIREINILIDTKIKSALISLEAKIKNHEASRINRIIKGSANVILELGKAIISPLPANKIMGVGGSLIKAAESFNSTFPENQLASFVYKVRERKFK
jgi:hypothetical protein